jgi:N-acetylneuraminate synthase
MVFVIAEAGVNHNGDVGRALAMVDAAAAAGADAVKFQTFDAAALASPLAPKARYQGKGSQLAMLKKLELSHAAHRRLQTRAAARGIQFLSSAFDIGSLRFLARALRLPAIKLGSGELTNLPLVVEAGRSGKKVILSTGMGTLKEIDEALSALAAGYGSRAALERKVTLLHCTSAYPAPAAEANLRAMATMRARFGLPVGYSDHSPGIAVSIAAVALGASVIEKHFTLSRKLRGPDHAASLEPDELAALVAAVRDAAAALGNGVKRPVAAERDTARTARKSLVAARAVKRGERFDEKNLTTMRPGTGIAPRRYWDFLGRRATRDYRAGEAIVA